MGLFGKKKKPLLEKKEENIIESNEQEVVEYSNEIDDSFDVVNLFGSSNPNIGPTKITEEAILEIDENEKIENVSEINEDFDIAALFGSDNSENKEESFNEEEEEEISYILDEPNFKEPLQKEQKVQEIQKEKTSSTLSLGKKSLFEKKKSLNVNKQEILQKMEAPKEEQIKIIEEKKNKSTFVSIDENYVDNYSRRFNNSPIETTEIKEEIIEDVKLEIEEPLIEIEPIIAVEEELDVSIEIPEQKNESEDLEKDNPNIIMDEPIKEISINEEKVEEKIEIKQDIKESFQEDTQEEDAFDALFSLFDSMQETEEKNTPSLLDLLDEKEKSVKDTSETIISKDNKELEEINSYQKTEEFKEETKLDDVIKEKVENEQTVQQEEKINSLKNDYAVDIVEYEDSNIAVDIEPEVSETQDSILGDILGQFESTRVDLKSSDESIIENNFTEPYEIDEDEIKRQEELLNNQLINEINDTLNSNSSIGSSDEIKEVNIEEEKEESLEDLLNSQETEKLDKTLDNFETESNNYLKEKRKGLLKSSGLIKNLKGSIKKEVAKIIEEDEPLIDKKAFISIDEEIDASLFKEKETDYSKLNEHFNPYLGKTPEEIEELRKRNQEFLEQSKNNDVLDITKELDSIINEDLQTDNSDTVGFTEDIKETSIIEEKTEPIIMPTEDEIKKQKEELARIQYEDALKDISAQLKVIKEDIESVDFSIFQEFANFIYNYRKLRKEYIDNKKKKEEFKRKAEKERQEREKEILLAQKQALLEEQLMRQGYGSNTPTLLGNVSENSRDKLMRLRRTAKDIPDEDETIYGVKVNNRDILLSELNEKLPRKALYDEFIDDSYEEVQEEYVSPNKNTFANQSMRPPDKRGTLKNRGFEEGYRREDDFK